MLVDVMVSSCVLYWSTVLPNNRLHFGSREASQSTEDGININWNCLFVISSLQFLIRTCLHRVKTISLATSLQPTRSNTYHQFYQRSVSHHAIQARHCLPLRSRGLCCCCACPRRLVS